MGIFLGAVLTGGFNVWRDIRQNKAETRQLRTGIATEIETGVAIIRDTDTDDADQLQFLASEFFLIEYYEDNRSKLGLLSIDEAQAIMEYYFLIWKAHALNNLPDKSSDDGMRLNAVRAVVMTIAERGDRAARMLRDRL